MTAGPNFFIVGAPKCGTTSLARWLAEHPRIFMSPVKEPHFYSTDLANGFVTSRRHYENLFKAVREDHLAIGEASTWYLLSREAIPAIEREQPGARYIVMTRHPVEMAHSLYHHNVRVLHEDQPSFEQAWRLQQQRANGIKVPRSCVEPAFLQYQAACSLGSQLERLYEQVAAERVLHVPLADLQKEPRRAYRRVLDFLGVPDDERAIFLPANEARGHRSATLQKLLRLGGRARLALGIHRGLGLGRVNERAQHKEMLSKEFAAELARALEDESKRLDAITKRA